MVIERIQQNGRGIPTKINSFSGQISEYRFGRVLTTLNEQFSSFKHALAEYVYDQARREAKDLEHQPLPSTINQSDVLNFSYNNFYEELKQDAPILHAAVSGAMATNCSYSEVIQTSLRIT